MHQHGSYTWYVTEIIHALGVRKQIACAWWLRRNPCLFAQVDHTALPLQVRLEYKMTYMFDVVKQTGKSRELCEQITWRRLSLACH